jgi:hypothetical protein
MIKELIEKRQRLHEENAAILAKVAKDQRDVLNADEETEWQSRDAAIDALTKNITMRLRQDEVERRIGEAEQRKTEPSTPGPESSSGSSAMRRLARGRDDFDMALRGWFLAGSDKPVLEEHRAAADRIGLNSTTILTLNMARRPPPPGGAVGSRGGPRRSRPRAAATRCPTR